MVCRGRPLRPRHTGRAGCNGFSLVEIMFVIALIGILTTATVPRVLTLIERARGLAAARYLASRMALARAQAVSRATTVALRFDQDARGISFSVIADGNRNGVRSRDVELQIDKVVEAPIVLSDLFPGAGIGLTPQSPVTEAIQLGGSAFLSFTPDGTSSSGSIYIRGQDGTQWAVRVLGVTARTRVLRYEPVAREWVYAF